jgi:flagellar export protein FliJ
MAKFVFPLQPLLAHRERTEQERQRDLAIVAAELVSARFELQRVEAGVRDALDDLRQNHLVGKIDLPYLAAHRRFMLAMQRQGAVKAQAVKVAQAKVDAAQRLLAEAAKQRKAIETLREQQRDRWADAQARHEAVAADEVAMQMAYHDGGAVADEAEAGQ